MKGHFFRDPKRIPSQESKRFKKFVVILGIQGQPWFLCQVNFDSNFKKVFAFCVFSSFPEIIFLGKKIVITWICISIWPILHVWKNTLLLDVFWVKIDCLNVGCSNYHFNINVKIIKLGFVACLIFSEGICK